MAQAFAEAIQMASEASPCRTYAFVASSSVAGKLVATFTLSIVIASFVVEPWLGSEYSLESEHSALEPGLSLHVVFLLIYF